MRAAPQERADSLRDGLHEVLAVVENEEHVQLLEHVGERVRSSGAGLASHADRTGDRGDNDTRIAHVRELDPPRAVPRSVGQLRGNLKGKTGLSRASPSHDRDQTIRADEVCDRRDFVDSPDEARQLDGKVVAKRVQRLQRREVVRQSWPGHLKDALGAREIPETMLSEIDQSDLVAEMIHDKVTGRLRHQDLATVRDRAQPRGANDRLARIVAVGRSTSFPRVDRHSHEQRRRGRPELSSQRSLSVHGGENRVRGTRKRGHDRVALALRERTHATTG